MKRDCSYTVGSLRYSSKVSRLHLYVIRYVSLPAVLLIHGWTTASLRAVAVVTSILIYRLPSEKRRMFGVYAAGEVPRLTNTSCWVLCTVVAALGGIPSLLILRREESEAVVLVGRGGRREHMRRERLGKSQVRPEKQSERRRAASSHSFRLDFIPREFV